MGPVMASLAAIALGGHLCSLDAAVNVNYSHVLGGTRYRRV